MAPVWASTALGTGESQARPGDTQNPRAAVQVGLVQMRPAATPRAARRRTHGSWAMRGSFFGASRRLSRCAVATLRGRFRTGDARIPSTASYREGGICSAPQPFVQARRATWRLGRSLCGNRPFFPRFARKPMGSLGPRVDPPSLERRASPCLQNRSPPPNPPARPPRPHGHVHGRRAAASRARNSTSR